MTIDIDYKKIKTTPYEFDKKVMETASDDLFTRNEKGKPVRLNKEVYEQAAMSILYKIYGESNE